MARIRKNVTDTKAKPKAPPKAHGAPRKPTEPVDHSGPNEKQDNGQQASGAMPPPIFQTLAHTTSNVVRQAASILEEEIAAGIIAAKQIEDKFINTKALRSGKPDEILQRFRRDAHEIIDMVVDLVGAAAQNAAKLAERAISIREGGRQPSGADASATPVLNISEPVKAGESGEISLVIENDSNTASEPFEFRPTDLISASGAVIPARAVTFSLKALSVGAHQSQRIVVTVAVPVTTPAGSYSGLIQTSRADQLRAVLTLSVA